MVSENGDRRCRQSNENLSPLGRNEPKPNLALSHDCAPLGRRGGASLPVDFPTDEVALLVEMVVNRAVDRGEFLECFILRNRSSARSRRRKGRWEFSALLLAQQPIS